MRVITVSAVLVLVGSMAVLFTGIVAVMHLGDRRTSRRLARTPQVTLAQLAASASLPARAVVTGRIVPGPAGILVSPAYGRPCVYYELEVLEPKGPGTVSRPWVGDRGGKPGFALDDGTGVAAVDLKLALAVDEAATIRDSRYESAILTRGRPAPAGSGFETLEATGHLHESAHGLIGTRLGLTETIIAPDQEITVVARPSRAANGWILLTRPGTIRAGSPADWREAAAEDVVTGKWMMVVALRGGAGLIALGILLYAVT